MLALGVFGKCVFCSSGVGDAVAMTGGLRVLSAMSHLGEC